MLFANPYGGLGNQLFGYAFARAVQEYVGANKLILSRRYFSRQYSDLSGALEYFGDYYQLSPSKVRICQGRCAEQIVRVISGVYRRMFPENAATLTSEQWKARVKKGYICARNTVSICDSLQEMPLSNKKLLFVEGLFQWPEVFAVIRPALQHELTLRQPLQQNAEKVLEEIRSKESVCLHVRRGDYLRFEALQVCNYEYYSKGMSYVAERVANPHFFVFSDDIEWVKTNYKIPYPHTFVQEKHAAPFELELMRNCKHFVISNSTFSWWAQYLSEYKDSVVVAPCPWFSDGRKVSLYLPNWHVIHSVGGFD